MKKRIKRRNNIVMTMIIILLLVGGWNTYSWYHPNLYIKDFSLVSDDYNNMVEFVREYYSVNGNGKRMVLSVDSKDFTLTYNDMKVHMPEAVKESLKKICKTSYKEEYDAIIISQTEVGFGSQRVKCMV